MFFNCAISNVCSKIIEVFSVKNNPTYNINSFFCRSGDKAKTHSKIYFKKQNLNWCLYHDLVSVSDKLQTALVLVCSTWKEHCQYFLLDLIKLVYLCIMCLGA